MLVKLTSSSCIRKVVVLAFYFLFSVFSATSLSIFTAFFAQIKVFYWDTNCDLSRLIDVYKFPWCLFCDYQTMFSTKLISRVLQIFLIYQINNQPLYSYQNCKAVMLLNVSKYDILFTAMRYNFVETHYTF